MVSSVDSDILCIYNLLGELVDKVSLPFKPQVIRCTGKHIWAYQKKDKKIYMIDGDGKNVTSLVLEDDNTDIRTMAVSDEQLAVCCKKSHKVHMYTHRGSLLYVFGQKRPGNKHDSLNSPSDICMDKYNYLYIVDCHNNRIVVVNADGKLCHTVSVNTPDKLDIANDRLCVVILGWLSDNIKCYTIEWNYNV